MKKHFIFLLFALSFSTLSWSQSNLNIYVNANYVGQFNFIESQASLGIEWEKPKGSLILAGTYDLYGTYPLGEIKDYYIDIPAFWYMSSFVGGTLAYRVNTGSRFYPFAGITLMGEVYTNYRQGMLDYQGTQPVLSPYIETGVTDDGDGPTEYYFQSRFYYGTPFKGDVKLGCDFRITPHFYMQVLFLMETKWVQFKYLDWDSKGDSGAKYRHDFENDLKDEPLQKAAAIDFGLAVGLTYTIPISHKKKTAK